MIQGAQKIIKIGSSEGITIPKKLRDQLSIGVGDEVRYTIELVKKPKHAGLMQEYDAFVKQYGQTLKNLAGR